MRLSVSTAKNGLRLKEATQSTVMINAEAMPGMNAILTRIKRWGNE